jgi:uncharacterized protein (UPF0335 family)
MTAQTTVAEFIEKLTSIESELQLLKDDRKELLDEYKDRINTKALLAAIRIAKIRAKLGDDVADCDSYLDEVDGKLD